MKKGLQLKYLKGIYIPTQRGKAKKCLLCQKDFGILTSEHQCKRCKRAVCDKCSPHKAFTIKSQGLSKAPHRQCNLCKEESDLIKKFIEQQQIVILTDTYSVVWMKSFGCTVDIALSDYQKAQTEIQNSKDKSEYNKMMMEFEQVCEELLVCFNFSLKEFYYYLMKDKDIRAIHLIIQRVLGTFLLQYPEVGYQPDQIFMVLFLLCFSTEASAYALLTFLYAELVPSYMYPHNITTTKYDCQTEVVKVLYVLEQGFKLNPKDTPVIKTFVSARLVKYLQPFTLNFLQFETSFFIINQMYTQVSSSFDGLIKALAASFSKHIEDIKKNLQNFDEVELIILRSVKVSMVQDCYFQTNKLQLAQLNQPVARRSAIQARSKTIANIEPATGNEAIDAFKQLQTDHESLQDKHNIHQKLLTEQEQVITQQKRQIEQLEQQIHQYETLSSQTQSAVSNEISDIPDSKDISTYAEHQSEDFQHLRRETVQTLAQQPQNQDIQKLRQYIEKLEHSLLLEHKISQELRQQVQGQKNRQRQQTQLEAQSEEDERENKQEHKSLLQETLEKHNSLQDEYTQYKQDQALIMEQQISNKVQEALDQVKSQYESRINEIQQECTQLKDANTKNLNELAQVVLVSNQSKVAMETQLEDNKLYIQKLEAEQNDLKDLIQQKQKYCDQLIEEKKYETFKLQKQAEALEVTLRESQLQNAELGLKIQQIQQKNDELLVNLQQFDSVQGQYLNEQKQNDEMKLVLIGLTSNEVKLREQIRELQNELETKKGQQNEELNVQQQEIQQITKEYQDQKLLIISLEAELKRIKEEQDESKLNNEFELEELKESNKQTIEKLQLNHSDMMVNLTQQLDDNKQTNSELQGQIDKLIAKSLEQEIGYTALTEIINQKQEQYDQLAINFQNEKQKYSEENTSLNNVVIKLEQKNIDMEKVVSALKEEINNIEKQKCDLELTQGERMQELSQHNEELKIVIVGFEADHIKLNQEINELKQDYQIKLDVKTKTIETMQLEHTDKLTELYKQLDINQQTQLELQGEIDQVNSKCWQQETEQKALIESITMKNEQCEKLARENIENENDLFRFKEENLTLNDLQIELGKKNSDLENKITSLQEEINRIEKQLGDLELTKDEQMQKLHRHNEELKIVIVGFEADHLKLQNKIQELKQHYEQRIDEKELESQALNEAITLKTEQYDQLVIDSEKVQLTNKEENQTLKDLSIELEQKNADLENKITSLKEEINRFEKQQGDLEITKDEEMQKLHRHNEELKIVIVGFEADHLKLKNEFQELKQHYEQKIDEKEIQTQSLTEAITLKTEQYDQLVIDSEKVQLTYKEENQTLKDLSIELEQKNADLENKITSLQEEIHRIEQQQGDLELTKDEQMQKLHRHNEELKIVIVGFEADHLKLKNEFQELKQHYEQKIDEKEIQTQSLTEAITLKKEQYDQLVIDSEKVQLTYKEENQTLKDLSIELEQKNADLENKITSLQEEIHRIEQQQGDLELTKDEQMQKLHRHNEELKIVIVGFEADHLKLKNEIQELKQHYEQKIDEKEIQSQSLTEAITLKKEQYDQLVIDSEKVQLTYKEENQTLKDLSIELEQKNADLQNEITSLKEEINRIEQQQGDLELTKDEQMQKLHRHNEELKIVIVGFEADHLKLKNEIQELKQHYEQKIDEKEIQSQSLTEAITLKKEQYDQLVIDSEKVQLTYKEENQTLKDLSIELEQKNADLQNEITSLKEEINRIEQQQGDLELTKDEQMQKLHRHNEELKIVIVGFEADHLKLKNEIQELKQHYEQKIDEKEIQSQSLTEAITLKKEQYDQLVIDSEKVQLTYKEENQTLKDLSIELEQKNADLQNEITSLQEEINRIEKQQGDLELTKDEKMQKLHRHNEELKIVIVGFEADHLKLKNEFQELKQHYEQKIDEKEIQTQSLTEAITLKTEQYDQLVIDSEKVQLTYKEENQTLKDLSIELEQKNADLENKITSLQEEIHRIEQQQGDLELTKDEQMQKLHRHNEELKIVIVGFEADHLKLKNEFQELKQHYEQKIDEKEIQTQSLTEAITLKTEQYDQLVIDSEKVQLTYKEENQTLKDLSIELEQKNADLENKITSLQEEIHRIEQQQGDLELTKDEQMQKLHRHNEELKIVIVGFEADHLKLKNEIQELKQHYEQKIDEKEIQSQSLTEAITLKKQQYDQLVIDSEKVQLTYKEENQTLKDLSIELEQKNADLQNEITSLKEEINRIEQQQGDLELTKDEQMQKLHRHNEELKIVIVGFEADHLKLKNEIQELKQHYEQKIDEKEIQSQSLTEAITLKKEQYDQLVIDSEKVQLTYKEENQTLKDLSIELEQKNADLQNEITSLKEEINRIEQQQGDLELTKDEEMQKLHRHNEELKIVIVGFEADHLKLKNEIQELKQHYEQKIDEKEIQSQSLTEAITLKTEQYDQLVIDSEKVQLTYKVENQTLKDLSIELESKNADLQNEITSLQEEINRIEKQQGDLELTKDEKMQKLHRHNEELKIVIVGFEADHLKLKNEIQELKQHYEQKIDEKERESQSLNEAITLKTEQYNQLVIDSEKVQLTYKEENQTLKGLSIELEQKNTDLENKITSLQEEINRIEQQQGDLELTKDEKMQKLHRHNEELKIVIVGFEADHLKLQNEIQELKQHFEQRIDEKELESQALNEAITLKTEQYDQLVIDSEKVQLTYKVENQTLKDLSIELEQKNADLQNEITSLQEQINRIEKQQDDLELTKDEQMQKLHRHNEELKIVIVGFEADHLKLKNEIQELTSHYEEKIEELIKIKQSKTDECNQLIVELETQANTLSNRTDFIHSLESEIEQLRNTQAAQMEQKQHKGEKNVKIVGLLQIIKQMIAESPQLNQQIFQFAEPKAQLKRSNTILDSDDVINKLEAKNHQITFLKQLLIDKQNLLQELNRYFEQFKEIIDDYNKQ